MIKGTVTGELKSIFGELGIKYGGCFSDLYGPNRVGVKFMNVFPTPEQTQIIKTKMEAKGFIYDFIKENKFSNWGRSHGTRFCFKYC